MSAWSDLGLPMANAKGYAYSSKTNFKRSIYESPLPDQAQFNKSWMKTFTISWDLTLEELHIAETYLLDVGYSWFTVELVSGETPYNRPWSTHTIRLISNYNITPLGAMFIRLSATAESKVSVSTCVSPRCDDFSGNDPNATCDLA